MNKLRTIPASAEEQSLKFSVEVVNKTAASAAQLAKCILLHVVIHVQLLAPSCERTNKNFIAYLTSWHNSIFDYKLRTIEAEYPKKLRIASLNSEFTGSYKKVYVSSRRHFSHTFRKYSSGSQSNWCNWNKFVVMGLL